MDQTNTRTHYILYVVPSIIHVISMFILLIMMNFIMLFACIQLDNMLLFISKTCIENAPNVLINRVCFCFQCIPIWNTLKMTLSIPTVFIYTKHRLKEINISLYMIMIYLWLIWSHNIYLLAEHSPKIIKNHVFLGPPLNLLDLTAFSACALDRVIMSTKRCARSLFHVSFLCTRQGVKKINFLYVF